MRNSIILKNLFRLGAGVLSVLVLSVSSVAFADGEDWSGYLSEKATAALKAGPWKDTSSGQESVLIDALRAEPVVLIAFGNRYALSGFMSRNIPTESSTNVEIFKQYLNSRMETKLKSHKKSAEIRKKIKISLDEYKLLIDKTNAMIKENKSQDLADRVDKKIDSDLQEGLESMNNNDTSTVDVAEIAGIVSYEQRNMEPFPMPTANLIFVILNDNEALRAQYGLKYSTKIDEHIKVISETREFLNNDPEWPN